MQESGIAFLQDFCVSWKITCKMPVIMQEACKDFARFSCILEDNLQEDASNFARSLQGFCKIFVSQYMWRIH